MKFFTYNEYQECRQNEQLRKKLQKQKKNRQKNRMFAQTNPKYSRSDQRLDFIIGQILQNPEQMKQFLLTFPLIQKSKYHLVEEKEFRLIPYANGYQEMVYFWPEQNLFFLFHYQISFNSQWIYSLLNSCVSIFEQGKKENPGIHQPYPIIIPIIINADKENRLVQKKAKGLNYTTVKKQGMILSYNVINIHNDKKIHVNQNECLLTDVFLLKKTECLERKKQLNELIQNTEEKEIYDQLKKIKKYLFKK